MFVLSKKQSYIWPVTVEIPMDGGVYAKHSFDAEFKRMPQSRIKEIGSLIEKSEINDVELVTEVLVGWAGIKDEDGSDLPFSEAACRKLLDISGVAGAIVFAFFGSIAGKKLKN